MAAPTSALQASFYLQNLNHDPQINSYKYHTIFAFTIASFLGILQVQEARNPLSMAFGVSLLGYYLAFKAKFGIYRYTSPIAILMAELANFSVASLASLLLSDSNSLWPVKFLIFLVLLSEPFYPDIKILFEKFVLPLFSRWRARSNTRWTRPLLPLQVMDAVRPATAATPNQIINSLVTLFGSSSPLIYTSVPSIATLGGGALNNGAPYQIVTAQATILGSSSPFAYRRAQPRPDQIMNGPATVSGSSPPFIYRRALPLPRAELSSPNEA